jgi:hypothetical protein
MLHELTTVYGPANIVYPVRTPLVLTMQTNVALADAPLFDSPVHGYVVCINFLVCRVAVKCVYFNTVCVRSLSLSPTMYQQHLCRHCPPILGSDAFTLGLLCAPTIPPLRYHTQYSHCLIGVARYRRP